MTSLSASDDLLAQTQAGDGAPQRAVVDHAIPAGARIGRYVVLERIGAGQMGVVHAAYDPELDRKVAIKVLRDWQQGERARSRLLREAQALARLSHPNVITIYDVGTHDDRVFVAMELVTGKTLRQWMQSPRPWREVVAVFIGAGRGLAAAHAAQLVHRDFKPDNVMVAEDARGGPLNVRVMDFGLARPTASTRSSNSDSVDVAAIPVADLTLDGAVLGTPAYMAPEQYERGADARSDQFSLCVALFEALYGRRPFEGDTMAAIAFEVAQGRIQPVPPGRRVPAWVHRIVTRGLAADPDARHPSVADLVDALERDPSARRRRIALGGLVIGAVAGVAIAS